MRNNGFILMYRRIKDWEWYDHPATRLIFEHCLNCANFVDEVWRGQKIKRGQFPTSIEKLAIANGLNIQQTRTALKNLHITLWHIKAEDRKTENSPQWTIDIKLKKEKTDKKQLQNDEIPM